MLVLLIFDPIFRREPVESIKIIGTVLIHAFVNIKMLTILLFLQSMITVGTDKDNRLEISLSPDKSVVTDFAQQLPAATGIIVEVGVRGATVRTDAIRRDRISPTGVDRLEALTVLGLVFLQQKDVV